MNFVVELIGWVGTLLILSAYFLLTTKKFKRDSKTYHAMNLFGGICIVINSTANGAYPPVVLNIIWNLIATYGTVKGLGLFRRK